MGHGAQGVHHLLADRNAIVIHRHLELGPLALQEAEQQPHAAESAHHQSLTPDAEPASSRRCCSSRVRRSRRSIELRICSAWLWVSPWLLGAGALGCGVGPPPPPLGGGGGRCRSVSSRFHLARADRGWSRSAWRRRSAASSSSSSRRLVSAAGGRNPANPRL